MFFSKQVYMKVWQNSMSGKNEEIVLDILKNWEYKLDEDFKRQFPIGDRYVADFAFPDEKVVIEVDGVSHSHIKERKKDKIKDKFYKWNDWVIIRIPEKKFFNNPSFWKHLIHEVVEERRKHLIPLREDIYEAE